MRRIARGIRCAWAHTISPSLIVALLIGALSVSIFWQKLADQYENIAYHFDSTAVRAFEYGDRHLSASGSYDIDRAEYFYQKAAALDQNYPYVYHQLARIAFLKGNFLTAMYLIDKQISLHGDTAPKSYYIRALIEGYKNDYQAAAEDYEHYLTFAPVSWAAHNDYAWVLLKANRPQDAVKVTSDGLIYFPNNPWLLNTSATALYEIGDLTRALVAAQAAVRATQDTTEAQWLIAYPGNDPKIAREGVAAFKKAALDNMHTIELASASGTVQSR